MHVQPKQTLLSYRMKRMSIFPMNLKTQPRECWTNFVEENAHLQDASKIARTLLGEHALRNNGPEDSPTVAQSNIPRTIVTSQRGSLSQSRIAVGTKFACIEPRLEVPKDPEQEEGNGRASICDKCTNRGLVRPATRAKSLGDAQALLQPRLRSQSAARSRLGVNIPLTGNPRAQPPRGQPFARSRHEIIQPAHLLCTSAMDYIPSSQPTPFLLFFSSSQTLCNIPRILHISSIPPIACTRRSLDWVIGPSSQERV